MLYERNELDKDYHSYQIWKSFEKNKCAMLVEPGFKATMELNNLFSFATETMRTVRNKLFWTLLDIGESRRSTLKEQFYILLTEKENKVIIWLQCYEWMHIRCIDPNQTATESELLYMEWHRADLCAELTRSAVYRSKYCARFESFTVKIQ